jgi:hypothetical protein
VSDAVGGRRVAIYGPPQFWRAAFAHVRERGDRVVRLLSPQVGPEDVLRLDAVLTDLRSGRIDEVLLDLVAP